MRPILLVLILSLAHELHCAVPVGEAPTAISSPRVDSGSQNATIESTTVSSSNNSKDAGKGGDQKDPKPHLEPPRRRPWGFFRRNRFRPPPRPQQQQKPRQEDPPKPTTSPTPDPAALTNFLAAAAFLLSQQNQQQLQLQANKLSSSNPPQANSISPSGPPEQPLVGPFQYTQMSNVYKDGQPIPSQVFTSGSGPSSSLSSPSGSGHLFSGPSPSSTGPSGFSSVRSNGFQSHYTNPNASPFQPSSIATSFFSRPYNSPTSQAQQRPSTGQDYQIAKSHYYPATVLPGSAPTTGPTASGNLSPHSYSQIKTSTGPSGVAATGPGGIQYITPTPHKPYAVTYEPGSKFLNSQMLNTNQLLSESDHFFKQFNKGVKSAAGSTGLSPEQFLKSQPIFTSPSYATPKLKLLALASPSPSFSSQPTAVTNLEEKMNLLLNLVPHLVRSGALPADSLLAPTIDTNKYVLPAGSFVPALTAQDLRFMKQQYLRPEPPKVSLTSMSSGPSGGSSLGPHASAYYSPSSASRAPSASLLDLSPSYLDFDSTYDLLANPSSGNVVKGGGPPGSSSSDEVIIYHDYPPSASSSPYSSLPHSHSHHTEPGNHPFANPSSSMLSALNPLNEDRPRSAIGSLLSSIRKLIV